MSGDCSQFKAKSSVLYCSRVTVLEIFCWLIINLEVLGNSESLYSETGKNKQRK
jgi:hypothetical protein